MTHFNKTILVLRKSWYLNTYFIGQLVAILLHQGHRGHFYQSVPPLKTVTLCSLRSSVTNGLSVAGFESTHSRQYICRYFERNEALAISFEKETAKDFSQHTPRR